MNSVCVRFDERARDLNRRTQTFEDRPRDAVFLRDLEPLLREAVSLNGEVAAATREVAAPEPPDRRKRDRLVARIESQAAILGRLAGAAGRGDTKGFAALQDDLQRAAVDRQRAVIALEAERCLY